MIHVWNPHRTNDPMNRVHAVMSMNQVSTLCGMGDIWKLADDGEQYQQYFPTGKLIDCHACTKSLELICRNELRKLTSVQLEGLIERIKKMRIEAESGEA